MIEALFHARIRPVVRRQRRLQLWRKLAVCWGVSAAAVFAIALMQRATGFGSPLLMPLLGGASVLATLVVLIRHWRTPSGTGGQPRISSFRFSFSSSGSRPFSPSKRDAERVPAMVRSRAGFSVAAH